MTVHVRVRRRRRHQRHVVKRSDEDAAIGHVHMEEVLEHRISRGRRGAPRLRRRSDEPVLRPRAELDHRPRRPDRLDRLLDTEREPACAVDHRGEGRVVKHVFKRRPRGVNRHGVPRQRSADPADIDEIDVLQRRDPRGDVLGETVRAHRDTAGDRFADRDHVRREAPGAGRAAGSSRERVRLVVDQQHAPRARELTHAIEVAGLRQHDPDVRQRRLHQHSGDVASFELAGEAVEVVELGDSSRQVWIHRWPDAPGPRDHAAATWHGERLVDGAVVAPGIDEDLGSAGEVASEANRPSIRVCRSERERPPRQPEPPRQLGRDPGRVLGRHHRAETPLPFRAVAQCGNDRRRRVTGHRPGVPESEVAVLVSVNVPHPRPTCRIEVQRERAGGLVHPRHRDATEKVGLSSGVRLGRARMAGSELRALVGE